MWCCVGTGMENHGKYGQFIYTHAGDSLWVNLFIPSELNWNEKGVKLTQNNSFPEEESTKITVSVEKPETFTLNLRHPGWCSAPVVKVNGKPIKVKSSPSSYIALNREWKDGDVVEMSLPMHVEIEELNHLPNYVRVVRGPIVLGARYDGDAPLPGLVAGDHRWGHIAGGPLVSVFDTPLLIGDRKSLSKKLNSLKPDKAGSLVYTTDGIFENGGKKLVLEPFNGIHDSRYSIYFLSMTPKEYSAYQVKAKKEEGERLALDARTVDAVNTGEQQPEADHQMKHDRTQAGNFNGEPWRDASNGGYFSYDMNTGDRTDLALRVRFWGNETGNAGKVKVLVDDVEIASLDNSGRWSRNEFMDEEFLLPADLLKGKKTVNVKFQADKNATTGGIYHVRLLHP